MSKIVDFAFEIEKEIKNLQDENTFLATELRRAENKNKQLATLIHDFLYEFGEAMKDE
jgi:hypothetical protein